MQPIRECSIGCAVVLSMVVGLPSQAEEFDELAVDEPLQVGEKRNVWPRDLLVVDRNFDLWADPRVRVVDTVGVVNADGEAQWLTNARTRAVARPLVPKAAATKKSPITQPASTRSTGK